MNSVNPIRESELMMTRRHLFGKTALGLGTAAMAGLMGSELNADRPGPSGPSGHGGLAGLPHHQPKAKSVIYLFMSGGPSHIDLWDYKPKLND
ncbi:MAG: DUF1501 domain-containing protein [Pirellulales bacterium]|nr:DUF1501 domain-containing protein [Pirellulales bacterium]